MILSFALFFWLLALGTVTFDLLFTFNAFHFTFKIYHLFFLLSFMLYWGHAATTVNLQKSLKKLREHLFSSPWLFFLILTIFATATAPFSAVPQKSIGYAIRGWFSLFVIAGTGLLIFEQTKEKFWKYFFYTLIFSNLILCHIVFFDHIAYFYGYHAGYIGYNQDVFLRWGLSRPHAFSYEPSYLGLYFLFSLNWLFVEAMFLQKNCKAWINWLTIFCVITALFITASRTAWFGSLASIFLIIAIRAFTENKIPKKLFTFAITLLLVLAAIFTLSPSKQKKVGGFRLIEQMFQGPTVARVESMKMGLQIGKDTKLFGSGIGASYAYWMFKTEPQNYPNNKLPSNEYPNELIMSIWAQLFGELGIIGIFCFLGFFLTLTKNLFSKIKKSDLALSAFVSSSVFFIFLAHWYGNVFRADIWIWFTVWAAISQGIFDTNREADQYSSK